MAQQRVRLEQFFSAPQDAVFAWFARHENLAKMFRGEMNRIEPSPDASTPDGVGARFEFRLFGMRHEETITAFDPPERIEYRVTKGWPMKNHVSCLSFETVDSGTQVRWSIDFESTMPFAGHVLAAALCKHWHRGTQKAIEDISGAAAS